MTELHTAYKYSVFPSIIINNSCTVVPDESLEMKTPILTRGTIFIWSYRQYNISKTALANRPINAKVANAWQQTYAPIIHIHFRQ